MKILEILDKYSDATIDQLSTDKVDESANLRLPRNIIIQEISAALSSLTYVAGALAPSRPPTYAFIRILLDAENYLLPIEGFQENVLKLTKEMTRKADTGSGLTPGKNYQLYLNVLKNAWEHENKIDRSEAFLLETLRKELNIWTREHLLLEHHPDVRRLWDQANAYISARNHLLITGLVLTYQNNYVIAEEVAVQIRRAWGIELGRNDYFRLLSSIKRNQIHRVLEKIGLPVSGNKEQKTQTVLDSLIPPNEFLYTLHIDELRDFCRDNGIQVSGTKVEVISNIIEFYDNKKDLIEEKEVEIQSPFPENPEEREITNDVFSKLLLNLTNDQLYDILSQSFLKTSGTKEEKVNRLIDSPWSERTLLNKLRRIDLSELCKKLNIRVSGVKRELIERLIEGASTLFNEATLKAVEQDQEASMEAKGVKDELEKEKFESPIITKTRIDKPKGYMEISKDFPELDEDEKIILSLIKETRSLTEHDIERASSRHGLGWFLIKAHMSEMTNKLKNMNKNPLNIRSVRSINIYEWAGEFISEEKKIELRSARDVIDALRQGVVPDKNLDLLVIGQKKQRQHLLELLEEAKNKSPFKFIKGPYGSGKTFLCSWLREQAVNKKFTTSTVNIGPDQPLSDLPIFYSGLINGLRTSEKRDSSALVDIIESWLLNIHKKTAKIENLSAINNENLQKLTSLVEKRVEGELSYFSDLDPGFAPALRAFYKARSNGDQVTASIAIAWLNGSKTISGRNLHTIGVKGCLESNQVFPRIRALIELIKGTRYEGLLLIVDELELIRRFPQTRQREQALEILRLLIDESGKNGFPGCLLIFTGTDMFFEDDRAGLKSYEALAERIISPNTPDGVISLRQPVINLEGLDHEKLFRVTSKIRDIHGVAYSWDSKTRLPDESLKNLVREWTSFGDDTVSRKPRPILRELINILDLCEENPDLSYNELFRISLTNKENFNQVNTILD
ncbi:MAG: hypothetical protein APR63_13230 [Desulfuromonas sp. SDB]|nr:MAG: hypothetical protein APR63_13230 [Desulfuromonas sp. SDB]